MTYKKTWLSYLLWAVYTCLTGVMLANYAILFWQKKINATIHSGTAFFVLFVFGMTTGAYILIRNIFGKTGKKYCISSHTKFLRLLSYFAFFLPGCCTVFPYIFRTGTRLRKQYIIRWRR